MLKYLIIQLDNTAPSFCHYENKNVERRLMDLEDLKTGIFFGMKENLAIQYILPDYELPASYIDVLESIDHTKIASSQSVYAQISDVVIFNGWKNEPNFNSNGIYIVRIDRKSLFEKYDEIISCIRKCLRLNIVITDVECFNDSDFQAYEKVLSSFAKEIELLYLEGYTPQLNLLTDRIMLDSMNNCNAGFESVTLAPDCSFYICPAFYLIGEEEEFDLGKLKFDVGSLDKGLNVKNMQLYKLSNAPLCRNCDAYQCKRCVWLNRKTTLEVNTPSREQCVIAHLERNASRSLLMSIRKHGTFLPQKEDIKKIAYLDPFDIRDEI